MKGEVEFMNDYFYNPSNPIYWSIYGSDSSQYDTSESHQSVLTPEMIDNIPKQFDGFITHVMIPLIIFFAVVFFVLHIFQKFIESR